VTPVLKNLDLTLNKITIYRLISQTSLASNILERYISPDLRHYVNENHLNDPLQNVYRPSHSIDIAQERHNDDLTQVIHMWRGVQLIVLDLSVAFDPLDHTVVLPRLRDIGLNHAVLALP